MRRWLHNVSYPELSQKRSKTRSLIPSDDEEQRMLGSGEEQQFFYQAVHPETEKTYKRAKLRYKNSPEQDAEEMFMDKIMTPDGEFIVERQVVVMTRLKGLDLREWLLIQEDLFGRTALGNPQKYSKMRDISEHDEPEIEQRMVPGSGEQIRKKGESVLYHRTKYDIPWTPDALAEAKKRVKEPLKLQLYAKEEGQRGYRIRVPKIWEEYDWDDLMVYCRTKKTKESRAEEALEAIRLLTPEQKQQVALLLTAMTPGGPATQTTVTTTETVTEKETNKKSK